MRLTAVKRALTLAHVLQLALAGAGVQLPPRLSTSEGTPHFRRCNCSAIPGRAQQCADPRATCATPTRAPTHKYMAPRGVKTDDAAEGRLRGLE